MNFHLFYVVIQLSLTREAAKWKRISTETRACVGWPKLSRADVQIAPVHCRTGKQCFCVLWNGNCDFIKQWSCAVSKSLCYKFDGYYLGNFMRSHLFKKKIFIKRNTPESCPMQLQYSALGLVFKPLLPISHQLASPTCDLSMHQQKFTEDVDFSDKMS